MKWRILIIASITLTIAAVLISKTYLYEDQNPIKIGVILPLTGDFESFGRVGLQGVELAVEDINSAGGLVGGKKIQLIVADNESDPYVAVKLMRKLIQDDGVSAIVGPVSSPARNAMTEVARQFRVPLLYGIDYEGGHFDRYLFCYSPIPDHVISPLLPYVMEQNGPNLYIFGYDYIWPHEMSRHISKEAAKIGGRVVQTEFTPFGVTDFTPVLQRVEESGADALILVMCGKDGQRFAKQFYDAGLKSKVGLVAIASEESWSKTLNPEVTEGIITISHFVSSMQSQEAINFTNRIKAMHGDDAVVTYSTESHYGLVRMFAKAIEQVGNADDMENVITAMEDQQLTVGNGAVKMRPDHHMNLNMAIARFNEGKLIVRQNLGTIAPRDQRNINR